MAEVYTEPTPSAFGPRPTNPGTPVPLDGDGTTTLDGIAAAFSRENYVAGAASAASAASGGARSNRGRRGKPGAGWRRRCTFWRKVRRRLRRATSRHGRQCIAATNSVC